jgi:hypothetical protein
MSTSLFWAFATLNCIRVPLTHHSYDKQRKTCNIYSPCTENIFPKPRKHITSCNNRSRSEAMFTNILKASATHTIHLFQKEIAPLPKKQNKTKTHTHTQFWHKLSCPSNQENYFTKVVQFGLVTEGLLP